MPGLVTRARGMIIPLLFALSLAACGGGRSSVATPTPSPPAARARAVAPCPESVAAGSDALEGGEGEQRFEGKPVSRVCLVGGTETSRRAAQRAIRLRPRDRFEAERVRADLQAIFELGFFDDAEAHGLPADDGASVVLVYSVHDRPRIADIGFEGAKVLGDATLDGTLAIEKGTPYDPAKLEVIAQAVSADYRSRGYANARVVVTAEPVAGAPDRVHVRFKVDEGPLWRLAKVDLQGNKKVPAAELRKVTGLEAGKPYVEEEVDKARARVSALYFERGYKQMRIDSEAVAMGPAAMHITLVIEEGAR